MNNSKKLPFQVSQAITELCVADSALNDTHKIEREASHKRMWDAVNKEHPELDDDGNYTLKCEFAKQGIVMLAEHEHGANCIKGKIEALFKRIVTDVEVKEVH